MCKWLTDAPGEISLEGLPHPKALRVNVFIGTPFEFGSAADMAANDSPETASPPAGEFRHWYNRYFRQQSRVFSVPGTENPVYLNSDGVMGTVIGIGKVRSSTTLTALLADPRFDFSQTCFLLNGCAGTPPAVGTVGAVFWAEYLVDYDLGHRWAADEAPVGAPLFSLREGQENERVFRLNPALVAWAYALTRDTPLHDSPHCRAYRALYPQEAARSVPFVGVGSHLAGDCFFHGPGLSKEAQAVCDLNHAGTYAITEMEGVAVALALARFGHVERMLSLRGVVNFDQGHGGQTTFEHLHGEAVVLENHSGGVLESGEMGKTPFDTGIVNVFTVGARFVEHVLAHWDAWLRLIERCDARG